MRRTPLKRTPLKRRPIKRTPPRSPVSRLTRLEREAAEEFKASTAGEPCAVCGWRDPHRPPPHHVVYTQHLEREWWWDTRNALQLCRVHHASHHNSSPRVPRAVLTEANEEFAREVLGRRAEDYLRRHYE